MRRDRLASNRSPKANSPWKAPPNRFSRSVQARLVSLMVVLVLIILLMLEAGKPKNWQWMWAGQRGAAGTALENEAGSTVAPDGDEPPSRVPPRPRQPALEAAGAGVADQPTDREAAPAGPRDQPISQARDFLVNVEDRELNSLVDGRMLDAGEGVLLRILYCLPRIGPGDLERLRIQGVSLRELAAAPAARRAEVFLLQGRVKKVSCRRLPEKTASLLEYDRYFVVHLDPDDASETAVVYARQVPGAWKMDRDMDQPARVFGLFLQVGPKDGGPSSLLFAAARIAWQPDEAQQEYGIDSGLALLGQLGMDVGLFDDARQANRKPMGAVERECFYQLLAAVGRATPQQLKQRAQRDFELAPLLQDPASCQGRLLAVQATARRVTEIPVDQPEIRHRLGIERYYQIDGFLPLGDQIIRLGTPRRDGESAPEFRNYFPATFCVLRLPAELLAQASTASRGESQLNEQIRLAGYYFKLWGCKSKYVSSFDEQQLQLSPLLVGLAPEMAPPARRPSSHVGLASGLAFVAVLAALWVAVRLGGFRHNRRRFAERAVPDRSSNGRIARREAEAEDKPDFSGLD